MGWQIIYFAVICLRGIEADVFDSLKNGYESAKNDVEDALGLSQGPAPAGSFLSAQAPVPLASSSPDLGSLYAELKNLMQNSSGPIVYKTASAALHLFASSTQDPDVSQKSSQFSLSNDTGMMLAAAANDGIVLAFNSSDDVYAQLLQAGTSSTQEPTYLKGILNGTGALPRAIQPLEDLIAGNGTATLGSVIQNLTGGAYPSRIITTGFGAGGGLAQLAAQWAAVTWTASHIRCITFGAPPVMNGRAAFAFQQFVDLPYIWAYNGSALVNTVLRTTDNNTDPTVNGRYNFEDYMQAVVNAGAYAQSNGTKISSPGISYEVAESTAAVPSAKGLFGAVPDTLKEVSGVSAAPTPAYEFANGPEISSLLESSPAPAQLDNDCPPILCKVRAPAEAACGDYQVYVPGMTFVPTLKALPGSQMVVAQPYDTHVVIDWDASSRTAIFIWRGSITEQDWLQDAKLKLINGSWLLSPAIQGIFPFVEIHDGFSEQFQGVTSLSANSSVNIFDQLAAKMQGVSPKKVLCSGHSLGAALASLCSVWASVQYPDADVLSVTLGQPYTGNQGYVDLYRLLVGREYRIVHQYDIVPSIPPVSSYRHVGLGMWELDGQVQLRDRPSTPLDDLNWDDHSCYAYSSTLQAAKTVNILPNATADVAQAPTEASQD